ncbi:hypothetical protein Taro_020627 [Colocasia esculenta]|uniref:Retrotransposon gag domain-containing protein n=1 Tax=Colocasia esculenta TaxID=4460 RepID=A0A843UWU3_COLES|nr:hypothetical protein [Colocasia esculenta]
MRHLVCRYPGGDTLMRRLQELLKATAPLSPSWTLSRPVQKGCAGLSVAILMATPCQSPSQTEKGLRHLLSRVLLQAAGFARVVDFGSSRGKWWDSDVVVCGVLLAETGVRRGTVVRPDYDSCGYLWYRVSLRREVSDMDRWSRVRLHSSSLRGVARRRAHSSDRDPDRAESWVHELERTFETMDCAELDQVRLAVYQLKGSAHEWWQAVRLTRFQGRRLEQISWQQFLEAFLGEYLPDYVCRERRDLFHELVQGDLTVGQYHQRFLQLLRHVPHLAASEQARTERFISGLPAAEWRFREIFSVPTPRRQSGECVFFFLFRNRRCWPDHEVEEVVHSWRQASLAAVEASDLAVSSGAVRLAGSRAEPAGFGLLPLRSVFVPSSLRERAVAAVLTVRPWIFQQVLEAQSADEDLADVLRLPKVSTCDSGKATGPPSRPGVRPAWLTRGEVAGGDTSMRRLQELLKATAPLSPSWTLSRPVQKGCAGLSVAILMATPCQSPSQTEKGLRHLLSRVLLQAAGFARVVDFGSSRGKWWDSDVVVCGALLAETGVRRGTVVRPDYDSCGYLWYRVSLRREVSDMDRETSQQFPPRRSEETGPQ